MNSAARIQTKFIKIKPKKKKHQKITANIKGNNKEGQAAGCLPFFVWLKRALLNKRLL
jgi:hypothetical protein